MVFPINFVAGAAIGAIATHLYENKSAQAWITETGKKVKDQSAALSTSIKDQSETVLNSVKNKVAKKKQANEKSVDEKAEVDATAASNPA